MSNESYESTPSQLIFTTLNPSRPNATNDPALAKEPRRRAVIYEMNHFALMSSTSTSLSTPRSELSRINDVYSRVNRHARLTRDEGLSRDYEEDGAKVYQINGGGEAEGANFDDDSMNIELMGESVTIIVKDLKGNTTEMKANAQMRLKRQIATQKGFVVDNFRLIFAGREILPEDTCAGLGMTHGATLHVTLKLRGC